MPTSEAKEILDLLQGYGIPLAQCGVDIGSDYVKVSPPANTNVGTPIEAYINRPARNPKTAEKR